MVESGGSGRPRPDNEESAEHPATPAPRATAPAEPPGPHPSQPEAEAVRAPQDDHRPAGRPGTPADTPRAAAPAGEPADRPAHRPDPAPADPSAPDEEPAPPAERPAADTPRPHPAPTPPEAPRQDHAPAPTPPQGPRTTTAPGGTPATTAETSPPPAATAPGEPPATGRDAPAHPAGAADETTNGHPSEPAPAGEPGDTHPDRAHAHAGSHDPDGTRTTGPTPALTKGPPPQRPPEQPRGGLLMGRPFGVPVYVAPSWFLVAALITWVFGGQLDRVLPELGAARYLVSLFFAVAFYASVLIHELAHTLAALRFKLPVRRIQLQFFGGVSEIEKEAETPGREFWLAFVGPLLSLALAGVFYLAMQPVEPGTVPGVLLAGLMISNLIVAIFNLLPGLPLDGGRMLRAVVWKITGKPMSGTVAAAWVGRALAVSVLIGLPLLTQSGALGSSAEDSVGMDTVTDALLAAILAAIIWTGAGNSLRMARLREHLPELRARTLTRRAVPVETDTPLSEALRRANAAGARALVVVDAHGEPLSLVREAAIVGVPEHRRPWVAVSGLAQDLTDGMRVSAELAGEDLLDVLRATPATEYLVVEETGEIYGVLSAADVERAFVKAMARPS
ncbi:site-2 protease family protein [Streptomyces sp. NPDC000345]|uniref:site-2 protease family protein n=1 Tax=Streptomyces sp. NPDC000345 TaxID=3364537 RepID=UPI0036C011DB